MDETPKKPNAPGGKKRDFPTAAVFVLLLLMAAFLIAGITGAFGQKSASSSAASSGSGASGGAGTSGAAASSPAAGAASVGADGTETSGGTGASGGTGGSGAASASSDGYVLPSSSGASASPSSAATPPQASSAAGGGPQSAAAASGMTLKEEYDRLADGMTLGEAQAICGSGALTTEVGGTQVYEWRDPDSGGSFIRATFKDGKLARKYKFGL